jgi:hypothetical protein
VTVKVGFRLDGPERRGQKEKTARLGKKRSPEFTSDKRHREKNREQR